MKDYFFNFKRNMEKNVTRHFLLFLQEPGVKPISYVLSEGCEKFKEVCTPLFSKQIIEVYM